MRWPVLGFALLAIGCSEGRPPDLPTWPELVDLDRVTASISGAVSSQEDLAEFEIPNEFFPELLRALGPPKYHKHPPAKYTQEIGRLRIVCRDGRVLEIGLVFYGKEPVLFTLQGVPCIRGGPYQNLAPGHDRYLSEVLTLEGFLRAVHRHDRVAAKQYVELLDRSAGRVPKMSQ